MARETQGGGGADERLRRSLEPDGRAVERIVEGALAPEAAGLRPRRASWPCWAAAGAATLVLGLLALWALLPRFVAPGPSGAVSLTNQGAVLIVRGPGDRVALVHTGPPPPGVGPSILILTHGETP